MTSENTTIEIKVSDETVATEVALGIIGRAGGIHNNTHDEFEHIAIELRDVGQDLLDEYPVTTRDEDE